MTDNEIISLYWVRDERAIKETDVRYGQFCYTLAYNVLHTKEDAEECVNDTYNTAWNSIPPQKPEHFRPWLGKVVRNISIDLWDKLHARKRFAGTEILFDEIAEIVPAAADVESEADAAQLGRIISRWLEKQSERDRMFFILRYWKGESLKSIAKRHGVKENNLAQKMYTMRQSLKICLEEEGVRI